MDRDKSHSRGGLIQILRAVKKVRQRTRRNSSAPLKRSMSGEASSGRPPTTVNVADLDLAQLADVKRQLDQASAIRISRSFISITYCDCTQELEHLTSSFAQLKQAQAKFNACAENVTQVAPPNASTFLASLVRAVHHSRYSPCTDNTILVPLTTSLYVPGNLSDPEHVIVDVGTGYFVQKVSVLYHTHTRLCIH